MVRALAPDAVHPLPQLWLRMAVEGGGERAAALPLVRMEAADPLSGEKRNESVSLFWASDAAVRQTEVPEATVVPAYHCAICSVRINAVWDRYGCAYCPNHHLNRRPG